jgi:hypothetical protein
MSSRPRASEARARPQPSRARPGRGVARLVAFGRVAALALATCALGTACRQSVLLDSPVDASGAGGQGGLSGASGAGGASGDMHGGNTGGMFGGGHFDGGRPDGLSFCFGGQIQYLPITLRAPYIIVSVDRSSDMQTAFGTSTRLAVVQQEVQTFMAKYRTVKWGYQEFPSTTGMCSGAQGCCAGDVVLPSPTSSKAIKGAIHACDNGGVNCNQPQRPTADALSKCFDAYKTVYNPDENAARYVLLVTSGDPTCMLDPMSTSTPCAEAVARASKLSNTNTFTSVFAVGDTAVASSCLDQIASLGGLDSHAAKTPNDLAAELDAFVESRAEEACKIDVRTPPADRNVQLLFDGLPIPMDANDGWTFDQNTNVTLTIHGSYCQTLVSGNVQVHLVAGCTPHN